jgi:hypothetical protein
MLDRKTLSDLAAWEPRTFKVKKSTVGTTMCRYLYTTQNQTIRTECFQIIEFLSGSINFIQNPHITHVKVKSKPWTSIQ